MGSLRCAAAVALVIGFVASLSPAAITIDGNAADWAGKLINLDPTSRAGIMDVVNYGCYVDVATGYAYFAQTIEHDAVNEFHGTGEGLWMNWWLDLDGDNTTGIKGWQIECVGWAETVPTAGSHKGEEYGVNEGIDIGVEVGHWQTDAYELYCTNGSDGKDVAYQYTIGNSFAFSTDGKFLEVCVKIDLLIAAANALAVGDTTAYGEFDDAAAAAGLWDVGARIDGKDVSLGVTYGTGGNGTSGLPEGDIINVDNPAGHEGLVTLPVIPGDVNLDGVVSLGDLTMLASNYNQSGMAWGQGDISADGSISLGDLTMLASYYGMTTEQFMAANPGIYPTPEPTTIALLGLGAVGLLKRRRAA